MEHTTATPSAMRRWSDADLGVLEDTRGWPAAEVATLMNRSRKSVYHMRAKLAAGWAPAGAEPWSQDDWDVVRTTPHLLTAEVAALLGRTYSAVENARHRLRSTEGIQFDAKFTEDPFRLGRRRLVARTCVKCGILLDGSWFLLAGRSWRAHCRRCAPRGTHQTRPQHDAAGKAAIDRLQKLTRATAERHGQPWLDQDDQILADPDLFVVEKALQLRRTYAATAVQLHRRGYSSRTGLGEPSEKDLWIITNPNAPVSV